MQLFEIGAFEWTDSRDGKLEGNRSIPSHVVLKLKHEGITAVRGKGRLVADGNFQKNTGEETFAPTPSMTSFRVLNGYAAKHGRHIETGDVSEALWKDWSWRLYGIKGDIIFPSSLRKA